MGRFSKIMGTETPTYVKSRKAEDRQEGKSAGPESLIAPVHSDPSDRSRNERRKNVVPRSDSEREQALESQIYLHGKLLDEIDLSTLEGLDEAEMRRHVSVVIRDLIKNENRTLNRTQFDDLVSGIINEMIGLGPLEVLLQDLSLIHI